MDDRFKDLTLEQYEKMSEAEKQELSKQQIRASQNPRVAACRCVSSSTQLPLAAIGTGCKATSTTFIATLV